MFILIGTSLFDVLPLCFRKSHCLKNVRFFHAFVDSCIGTIFHHKDFTGQVPLLGKLYHNQKQVISHTEEIFLTRYRSPNGPHLLRMVQPIWSPENPGTTVVSIWHLTPWPENHGYRTQVWDKKEVYPNYSTYLLAINLQCFITVISVSRGHPLKHTFAWFSTSVW